MYLHFSYRSMNFNLFGALRATSIDISLKKIVTFKIYSLPMYIERCEGRALACYLSTLAMLSNLLYLY